MKNYENLILASTVFEVDKKELKTAHTNNASVHKKATSANEFVYHETYY